MNEKYSSVHEMMEDCIFYVEEQYHIYYKGFRIHLKNDSYNSINGAKKGIKNYFRWKKDFYFEHMSDDEFWHEINKDIEIVQVKYPSP